MISYLADAISRLREIAFPPRRTLLKPDDARAPGAEDAGATRASTEAPVRAILPYAVLAVGVLAVSSAAILTRFAQALDVPALPLAAWRLALAALILTPFALMRCRDELGRIALRDIGLALASGALLAVHFAAWIASLEYTSVAASTVLVTTNPIWIAAASWVLFRERPGRGLLGGIAIALAGSVAIFAAGAGDGSGRDPTLGNALALAGSIAVSGYLLLGRSLRRRLSLLAYVWLVYGAAAGVLLATVAATAAPMLGFAPAAYALLAALALGPQLAGHSAFNWALRYLSPAFIAIAILGEPVGAAILAYLVLGERIGPLELSGFLLLLCGIYVAARAERRSTR
jgi:drug/metabolite transporter (DMT)-like permease